MGKAISALGSASGSAGSALGSAAGNVVSPVIVQAASKGTTSALGSTLGRAIGAGLSGIGTGVGTALSQPSTQTTPSPAPANENTVDAVTVTAPRLANTTSAPSSLGASLVPSVLGALSAGMPTSAAESAPVAQPAPLANISDSTEVAPIEITAPVPGSQAGAGLGDALGAGLGDIITGGIGDENLYDTEPGEQDMLLDGAGEGGDLKDAGMLALLAGLGLKPKDLLGMGLLGAGLLTGTGKTDPTTTPGTPAGELTTIAQNNQALANMLSQRAQAGMNGQIGGMGMNAIKRMVRNAQAAIRQRYAGMGMSGSSAEAADLNAAAEAGVDMQFRIGQQAAQTGLNAVAALTGQSANIYQALMNAQTQKDTALGNALANFAGAVGGRLLAG